jgi:signal transduction histidine kinase
MIDSIYRIKHQYLLVEEPFFIENFKKIVFPTAKLLYHRGEPLSSSSFINRSSGTHEEIRLGQQFEFQQKNYIEALKNYQQAFASSTNNALKGEILNHIARVQVKADYNRDAIQTYQMIIRDFSGVESESGLPLSLAASIEVGSLYLMIRDTLNTLQSCLDTYLKLIQGKWTLDKSQYIFFKLKVRERIDEMLSSSPGNNRFQDQKQLYTELKREDDACRLVTERLITFQENFSEDLWDRILAAEDDSLTFQRRFDLERGKNRFLFSIFNRPLKDRYWGFLYNQDYLKENLIQQVIERIVKSPNVGWIIRDEDGQPLLKSEHDDLGPMTVQSNFIANFPPWFLEFYHPDSFLFDSFLFSRRSVYFYMFFLIGGILIFGLVLSIRAVTHEFELSRMKSDFVSTISHEFKSPLTSIRQISEMLQSDRLPSDERRYKYYDVLVDQSERLSLLIDNILDFSKLEEGKRKLQFETVDIETLLKEIILTFQHRIRHEGFSIQTKMETPLPPIEIDKSAITQAISNILENAIKFSGERKEIFLRAFAEAQHMNIAVQDFGVGMKTEDMDKIFERFYRGGDELTRTVKGSGLGLTIVKQIVEAHHGSVYVDSKPGEGCTFTIRLPL